MFLAARLDSVRSRYAVAIGKLHAAAQLATAAHDLEALAEIWIYLVQSYGNDLRTVDQASLFDGYVAALLPQLPDRDGLTLQLDHARCQRNTTAASVAPVIASCETAIRLATAAHRLPLVSADRVRLGHFQRLAGNVKQAIATLQSAVAEANHVFGEQHPDTALAHYALGIAYAADKQSAAAIAELRTALAIRRAAFPGDSLQVAESLQGLGDVLGESGKIDESVRALEDALAMLDRIGEGQSAQATNSHILLGMSLDELHRSDDAIAHYLRAADIADRSLEHGEDGAAIALQQAAETEAHTGHAPTALEHLERALRLRERGHAPPQQLGETQLLVARLALELHDPQRARAMAEAARASYVTANASDDVATVDKFLARLK
jgi:tetratricopeptide (TPR) repeat protein